MLTPMHSPMAPQNVAAPVPEGTHLVQSNTVPAHALNGREPIAFLDKNGHVWPHQSGSDLHPDYTYFLTPEEVRAALAAKAQHTRERIAAERQDRTGEPPNLFQGGQPKPDPSPAVIAKSMQDSRMDLAQMMMQMGDPAGKVVARMPGR